MIISLGSILLRSEPRREDTRDVAAMHIAGATSETILKEIMDQAYDKFNLDITDIQVNLHLFRFFIPADDNYIICVRCI